MQKQRAAREITHSFAGLTGEFIDPATASIAVVPVPYDRTSTWKKGADRGPAAMLEASANMELYDIETKSEVYRRGICTLEPIEYGGSPEELADLVERATNDCLDRDQLPVILGGEHSVSIGAIRAAAKRHKSMSVLQIDAHGDTRESYEGSAFNHACVMARAREWCSITQVGIRAIDGEEVNGLDDNRVFYAHDIAEARHRSDDRWMDQATDTLEENVYITIDLDAFDPSVLPATGTPEPGGLLWRDVNVLVDRVARTRRIVGFDVVELLPHEAHWGSSFLAAKLVYRVLSMIFAHRE